MKINNMIISCVGACLGICASHSAYADFLNDSKVQLDFKNYEYYQRQTGQFAKDHRFEREWAQAVDLNFISGYTDTPIGVGTDILFMNGFRLDSGRYHSGTGNLQTNNNGHSSFYYGKINASIKFKYQSNLLRIGRFVPTTPILIARQTRMFPQSFQGGMFTSKPLANLDINSGYLDRVIEQNKTGEEVILPMTSVGRNITIKNDKGGKYYWLGGDYSFNENNRITLYHADLTNYFYNDFIGYRNIIPLEDFSLTNDFHYFRSGNDGHANVSKIDNQSLSYIGTFAGKGHTLCFSYEKQEGSTGLTMVYGSDHFVTNPIQWGGFDSANESAWQIKYGYDFSRLGINGLSFYTMYTRGSHIHHADIPGNGHEWESDNDISYTLQSGTLKGLNARLRYAKYHSNFLASVNDVRLIIDYPLNLR